MKIETIIYWFTHNIFRTYQCNNYPDCMIKVKGYRLQEWHKGVNFIMPACPKCRTGVMI